MKTLLRIASFALLSVAGTAGTVYFASNALDTTNNSGHATLDLTGAIPPEEAWAPALPDSYWISYGPTGDESDPGYFSPPNGTVVTFTTEFFVSGSITSADLIVLADDTTTVVLNGHTLANANFVKGPICAAGQIGCLTSTEGIFSLAALAPYLIEGTNTLSFAVYQVNGVAFGLDFAGAVDPPDPNATPEPGTLALIAGGLIAFAILHRRK
jgi:hypothetical protein